MHGEGVLFAFRPVRFPNYSLRKNRPENMEKKAQVGKDFYTTTFDYNCYKP